jgi:hypothetical protein
MPTPPEPEIKVGDLVRWKSQANGTCLLKVGVVVYIAGPNERVPMHLIDYSVVGHGMGRSRHYIRFDPDSMANNRVSCVVSVKTGVTDRAKRTLYHPRQEVILARPGEDDGVFGWHNGKREWVRV